MPFWSSECGEDVIEYSLLIGFVILASLSLILLDAQSVEQIWHVTNNVVNQAAKRVPR